MPEKKLSNEEAWQQAAMEVSRRNPRGVGDLSDDASLKTIPTSDVDYWDAVEKRAVELGGTPAGPMNAG